jgi:4a-hydroxytetrahydrobiopterin dehydratase
MISNIMARTKLSEEEIRQKLAELGGGWSYESGKLSKRFKFDGFVRAFGWMSSVALVAEKMDHHPDWKNVYNRVDVELLTHDAGGVTARDFELARHMEELAAAK